MEIEEEPHTALERQFTRSHPIPMESPSTVPLSSSDVKNYIQNTNFSNSDTNTYHNISSTTATTLETSAESDSLQSSCQQSSSKIVNDQDQSFNFMHSNYIFKTQDSPRTKLSASNLNGDNQFKNYESSPTKALIDTLAELHISEKENRSSEYQSKLNYKPNLNFNEQMNSENSSSLDKNDSNNTSSYKSTGPNTIQTEMTSNNPSVQLNLKYKSPILKEKRDSSLNHLSTPPVKTSTVRPNFNDATTPDWMPKELNEKWTLGTDLKTMSVSNKLSQQNIQINTDNGNNNNNALDASMFASSTIVHNKDQVETPEWKKVAQQHEMEQMKGPQLKELFSPFEESVKSVQHSTVEIDHQSKDDNEVSNNTTSTYSTAESKESPTPNAFQSRFDFNTNQNIQPPLKLFGDQYNTFTKDKLSDLLQNFRAQSNDVQAAELAVNMSESDQFQLYSIMHSQNLSTNKTQDSSKAGTFEIKKEIQLPQLPPLNKQHLEQQMLPSSEEDFIKNANDIFKNLQLRGFKVTQSINELTKSPQQRNDPDYTEYSDEVYSSFTGDFDDSKKVNLNKEISAIEIEQESFNSDTDVDLSRNNLDRLQQHYESNSSSYTFDQTDYVFPRPMPYEGKSDVLSPTATPIEKIDHRIDDSAMFEDIINAKISELEKKALEAEIINLYNGNFQKLLIENQRLKDELMAQREAELHQSRREHNHRSRQKSAMLQKDNNADESDSDLTSIEEEVEDNEENDDDISREDLQRMQNFISWKRISQLRLQHLNDPDAFNKMNGMGQPQNIRLKQKPQELFYKGNFLPDNTLPLAYEDMILDLKNNKWISSTLRNKGANKNTSLDSIDDLITNSKLTSTNDESAGADESNFEKMNNSILKSSLSKSNLKQKKSLEVSFNLPNDLDSDTSDILKNNTSSFSVFNNRNNVTNISQLSEVTFTQTRKRLISIITECLASKNKFKNMDWDSIEDIDLSNQSLSSLKDMDKFLPHLKCIDLSNNEIKFLDGLPTRTLRIVAENNLIENISSFSNYHDLQFLNLSGNNMVKLSNLGKLIHLTELKIENNQLISMDGLNNLTNLIRLDLSHNHIMGEIDFNNFQFKNLQEINLSENNIQSVIGLSSLENLRVLNLNENQLINLENDTNHSHLKKILIKFNNLKKLNVTKFPSLRVIRFDGNQLSSLEGIRSLSKLEEISAKSQSPKIVDEIIKCRDINKLDLSGNIKFDFKNCFGARSFLNLNELVLSAMDLFELPSNFSQLFPNLRELNLNFNKLKDISALSGLKNLDKLYVISNNLAKTQIILKSLTGSNKTLKLVDFRLNPINIGFYPYVFNPSENEKSSSHKNDHNIVGSDTFNDTEYYPIQLDTLDDIESFSIHYQSLNKAKGQKEWSDRDEQFSSNLKLSKKDIYQKRLNYETIMINYLPKLRLFDGNFVGKHDRRLLKENFLKK